MVVRGTFSTQLEHNLCSKLAWNATEQCERCSSLINQCTGSIYTKIYTLYTRILPAYTERTLCALFKQSLSGTSGNTAATSIAKCATIRGDRELHAVQHKLKLQTHSENTTIWLRPLQALRHNGRQGRLLVSFTVTRSLPARDNATLKGKLHFMFIVFEQEKILFFSQNSFRFYKNVMSRNI